MRSVLIDDITMAGAFKRPLPKGLASPVQGGTVRLDRMRCPDGVEREWQIVAARGLVLRYCPDIAHIRLRLSVPRWAYPAGAPWSYNFPLAFALPDLDAVSAVVGKACQLAPVPTTTQQLQLQRLPVSRIAYTVDVAVDDVVGSIQALSCMRRPGNAVQTWGSPPHACQWRAETSSTIAYSKELEIRSRRGAKVPALARSQADYRDEGRAFRTRLAEEARGVVRFEVNLKPKGIRDALRLRGGYLPTYDFMTRPDVAQGFLAREMRRLGLDRVPEPEGVEADDRDVVALAMTFRRAIEHFEAQGKRLAGSGGKAMSCNRIATLMKIYELTGVVDDQTLMDLLRLAPATLRARRQNLRQLGLPPLGGAGKGRVSPLRDLALALGREVSMTAELPEADEDHDIAAAPWLGMLPEDDEGEDEKAAPGDDELDDTFASLVEAV